MLACCNLDVTEDCDMFFHADNAICRYTADGQLFLGRCNGGACEPTAGRQET